jgi:tetratricopeptide (TPR) repeat protein
VSLEHALALRARCDYRGALAALADADDAAALIERSRLHEDFGNYDAALADAERAGTSPEALVRRAGVAIALRDPSGAERILEGVPGDEARAERACALLELARLDEAELLFRSVASDDPRVRLTVRGGIGALARARGRYDDAERELRAAIEEAERTFGADSLETGGALNGLGMVFKYCGRFDEGAELYRRALEILERAVGETRDVAAIYHNLGGLEHARRNFEAAEPYARRSVEIRRRYAGADDPAVAEDEAALAPILHALGREEEAEQLLRHALEVLGPVLGPDHPEVAGAWNNLAAVLQRRGELDAAEEAYRRALEAKERTIGPEHPAVATTLNNLGVNARKRGRDDEAEAYYRRALEIFDRRVEPDHPNRLLALGNYAKLLRAAGRDAEAAGLERRREEAAPVARLEETETT